MKKLAIILLLSAFAGSVAILAQTGKTLTPEQQNAIEKAIREEMKESGTPGASMAIINKGEVAYEKWFGTANALTKAPVNEATVFQIGSITKIFTALALITELKKSGIDVQSPVGAIVKGLSPGLSKLTYHQLLTHTGGMTDYWPAPVEGNMDAFTFFKDRDDSLLFAQPGEVFSYSNIGFTLAGLALEKLTGKPYPEAINDIILKPLELNNTTFDFYAVAGGSFSAGHVMNGSNGQAMPFILDVSCPIIQAAGGLYSTIHDMERFAFFLMNQGELDGLQVIDKAVIDLITGRYAERFTQANSPYGLLSFPGNAYGYGIYTFDYGNLKFTGGIGITTQMTYLMVEPEKKSALIVLSNLSMDQPVNSIKSIFEVVMGETGQPAAGSKPDKAEIREITGSYLLHAPDYRNEVTADVLENNGRLVIRLPGADEMELTRTGVLEYSSKSPDGRFPGEILFEKDAAGKIRFMRYNWGAWEKVR